MQDREERYVQLYEKVNSEIIKNEVADSLMKICSVWLDRKGNENQVNVELLLESSMPQKIAAKKLFDKYCSHFGLTMNYVNLIGDLPSSW